MGEASTNGTHGERLAAMSVQIDGMTDSLMQHIQAAEARIAAKIDAMGWRISTLETQHTEHRAFREGFVDDDGNHINGKALIRRIVAMEKTISTFRALAQMGKGALALGRLQLLVAGLLLLVAIKGTWEGVEWIATWLVSIAKSG